MFRVLNAAMAVLFLFGAIVQYNDPDPLRWMAIYLLAGVACGLAVLQRLRWWFPALLAAVALIWAAVLAPRVLGMVRVPELFEAWEMANERVEQGREMYGLLMIGVYMSILVVTQSRIARKTQ